MKKMQWGILVKMNNVHIAATLKDNNVSSLFLSLCFLVLHISSFKKSTIKNI